MPASRQITMPNEIVKIQGGSEAVNIFHSLYVCLYDSARGLSVSGKHRHRALKF